MTFAQRLVHPRRVPQGAFAAPAWGAVAGGPLERLEERQRPPGKGGQMVPILVMELRGFSDMASQLARELDSVAIDPERIRAAGIDIVSEAIDSAKGDLQINRQMHLGGDTWYFTLSTVEEAVIFGTRLLRRLLMRAVVNGIYYIKPSVALGFGEPKFQGERFLDDVSIEAYKTADRGRSFHFFVVGAAIPHAENIPGVVLTSSAVHADPAPQVRIYDWQASQLETETEGSECEVTLPSLLLDSEVIYSDSPAAAIGNIKRQQARAASALVFGGPIAYTDPVYRDYVRATVALLRAQAPCKFTLLSFLPMNELPYTYAWLELCRRLAIQYPQSFAFAAFTIPDGQLRPFSYHVYDASSVHIGLRSFSPQRGVPTLSSAIMFKNAQIAARFTGEFLENYRTIGAMDDKKYANIVAQLPNLTPDVKRTALQAVEELLAPAGA